MAEQARRLIETDTALRNFTDEELVRSIASDLSASDLERELAHRLTYHKEHRRYCTECGRTMKP